VDYDALTTLNISATQQLKKKMQLMKEEFEKKVAELQKQLSVFTETK
jgi:hypothetical protein